MAEHMNMSFFRITVVGAANAGKTCLINSFVNNYCPTVYTETEDPTIYYRTVRIPTGDSNDFEVLLEIEDTYPSKNVTGKDVYGNDRNIKDFLAMSQVVKHGAASGGEKNAVSFGPPMNNQEAPERTKYRPMTKNRMGFLLVYDATDEKSFKEAVSLWDQLQTNLVQGAAAEPSKSLQGPEKPVVYLVANKIDKDGAKAGANITDNSELVRLEIVKLRKWSQYFADKNKIRFFEVSALEFKNVRKLWWDMIEDIALKPKLWQIEEAQHEEAEGLSPAENCTVQ